MQKFRRLFTTVLICSLALCLLAGCGGSGSGTGSAATKTQLISALNAARKNPLKENSTLSQLAEKELEAYISQAIKGETNQNSRDATREQINKAAEQHGLTMVAYVSNKWPVSGQGFGFQSDATTDTADYVGCAIKEEGGIAYYSVLVARNKVGSTELVKEEINNYNSGAVLDSSLTAKAESAAEKWKELMSGEPRVVDEYSYYGLDPQTQRLEYADDDTDAALAKNIAAKVNGIGGRAYGYARATLNGKTKVLIVVSMT